MSARSCAGHLRREASCPGGPVARCPRRVRLEWRGAELRASFVEMFRSDAQVNAVCRVLVEQLYLKDLWTDEGPTEKAHSYFEQDGGPISRGERVLLLAAFAIWNGSDALAFTDVFKLDDERLAALATLLLACSRGSTAIQEWIVKHDSRA